MECIHFQQVTWHYPEPAARMPPSILQGSRSAHQAVAATAKSAAGTWTLMRAPEPLRAAVDVLPPEPEALAHITRRVKAALDPQAILNPGRMYAGL